MGCHVTCMCSQAFKEFVDADATIQEKLSELRGRVETFAENYPMPGLDNH